MKHVYVPSVSEDWEWALPKIDSDNSTILDSFGKPIATSWTPIPMKFMRQFEGRLLREADMPWLGEHILIFRPRALAVLRDLCLHAGELLPLACDDAELVAWNVTTVVDALDQEKSKLMRFNTGRIMQVKHFAFRPAAIADLEVAFRVPDLRNKIFLGPAFVTRVREAALTGTHFQEVWPIN